MPVRAIWGECDYRPSHPTTSARYSIFLTQQSHRLSEPRSPQVRRMYPSPSLSRDLLHLKSFAQCLSNSNSRPHRNRLAPTTPLDPHRTWSDALRRYTISHQMRNPHNLAGPGARNRGEMLDHKGPKRLRMLLGNEDIRVSHLQNPRQHLRRSRSGSKGGPLSPKTSLLISLRPALSGCLPPCSQIIRCQPRAYTHQNPALPSSNCPRRSLDVSLCIGPYYRLQHCRARPHERHEIRRRKSNLLSRLGYVNKPIPAMKICSTREVQPPAGRQQRVSQIRSPCPPTTTAVALLKSYQMSWAWPIHPLTSAPAHFSFPMIIRTHFHQQRSARSNQAKSSRLVCSRAGTHLGRLCKTPLT